MRSVGDASQAAPTETSVFGPSRSSCSSYLRRCQRQPRVQRRPPADPVASLDAEADIVMRRLLDPRPGPLVQPAQQQARPRCRGRSASAARHGRSVIWSNWLSRYSLRDRLPPARSRHWLAPGPGSGIAQRATGIPRPARRRRPMPEVVSSSWSRRKGNSWPANRDIDDPLVRARADIGVGRDRGAEAQAPALARPHDAEEPVDVERHPGGRLAGQHQLEMARGPAGPPP